MGKSWEALRKRLNVALAPHGAVSKFCRKTGFSRRAVDEWLTGESVPSIEKIDGIAKGLDTTPLELFKSEEGNKPIFATNTQARLMEPSQINAGLAQEMVALQLERKQQAEIIHDLQQRLAESESVSAEGRILLLSFERAHESQKTRILNYVGDLLGTTLTQKKKVSRTAG